MAKAIREVKQVPGGFQAVVYVEYPLQSAYSVSPEKFLTSKKRVDLAKSEVMPTYGMAEQQFPVLFVQYNIKQ